MCGPVVTSGVPAKGPGDAAISATSSAAAPLGGTTPSAAGSAMCVRCSGTPAARLGRTRARHASGTVAEGLSSEMRSCADAPSRMVPNRSGAVSTSSSGARTWGTCTSMSCVAPCSKQHCSCPLNGVAPSRPSATATRTCVCPWGGTVPSEGMAHTAAGAAAPKMQKVAGARAGLTSVSGSSTISPATATPGAVSVVGSACAGWVAPRPVAQISMAWVAARREPSGHEGSTEQTRRRVTLLTVSGAKRTSKVTVSSGANVPSEGCTYARRAQP